MTRRLLVLSMVVGLSGGFILAAAPEEAMLPELVVGTLAGYAGGLAGAFVLTAVLTAGAEGWEVLGATILGTVLGYTGGAALGASLGVATTGSLLGVEGHIGLCFLGGAGGAGLMIGLRLATEFQPLFWLLPPAAAAGATAGFNMGARVR
ncbi:hypothetical protein H5T52_04390 [Candidatus Bipolaricaulota bacterium]|nr:hypothetical protein [Candidatus Bipolaricaulota bacterium]